MATDKYLRANARAQARGYASAYAERAAQAKKQGFRGVRAKERAGGRVRDYELERERARIRARGAGFSSVREKAAFRRENTGLGRVEWQQARTLARFGITKAGFDKVRRANRKWSNTFALEQWTAINTYDKFLDAELTNWTEQRVGYVLSFYAAIVNPRTNLDSLYKMGRNVVRDENGRPVFKEDGKLKRFSNKSQFYYLVKYTGLMQVDEFEARYGRQIVKDARTGTVEI